MLQNSIIHTETWQASKESKFPNKVTILPAQEKKINSFDTNNKLVAKLINQMMKMRIN